MEDKKRNVLGETLTDQDGSYSSKRMVAFISFVVFIGAGISGAIWDDFSMGDAFVDGLMWMVLGGLGFTAIEKIKVGKS